MKRAAALTLVLALLQVGTCAPARGYVLNRTIAASGGCLLLNRFDTSNPAVKKIDRRWSTSANGSVRTSSGAWVAGNTAQLIEIQDSILNSFAVWTSVSGTTLAPGTSTLTNLQQTSTQQACTATDGNNTLCFNQSDSGFTSGVLAFTRSVTSDIVGETLGPRQSAFIGEILDADIYFRTDGSFTFATPAALATNQTSFDFESVLTHELGHFFGFSHSSVARAVMWPFAPPRGQFLGDRPTATAPDAPLAEDDRTGLRVLYPDANDAVNIGSIRGRVLPANPLALATLPAPSPGRTVTGIFGAHVVAVDAQTGAVIAGTLGGWTCDPADLPTRFDGSYALERLPVGRSYKIYAEPLDGPTDSGNITGTLNDPCRAGTNNACTVPAVNTNFTTKVKP